MLNDKYAQESATLSEMQEILNNIGFLSEKKEKEDDDKDDKAGEEQEHKYPKSGKKSKDFDGDGDVEDEAHEYAGVKDKAIKKAMKKESMEIDSILDELTDEDVLFLTDELIEEVVQEFFDEMIEEGFEVDEIETLLIESIDTELTVLSEAKVTLGHDTEDTSPKEDKLSKVKSAVKKIASGAKKVATKVAGAAGEVVGAAKAGYKKAAGSDENSGSSSSSSSSGSSSGRTVPRGTSQKPGFLARAGAALKAGLKKVVGKTARVASKVGDKVATRLGEEMDGKDDNGFTSCWKGYVKKGTKMKGGKEVNNCVPKEEYEELVMDMIEEGYDIDQVREVIAAYEDGFEVIFEEDGVVINETQEALDEETQFLADVEMVADWLYMEGVIENEDQFFELMEDLTEEEIQELYDVVFEATAMTKRGHDETEIRNKIANATQGGKSADRATALENKPTYGDANKAKQRQNYARAQRGDHRKTTSSNPGLHGYAHKSDDAGVKAKQAARGAQRGKATLTPKEKKDLNMGYEMIGDSLDNGGLEVRTYSWREVLESQEARNNPEKYEREQNKKTAPVRGEKTPMPPRGDKRREDFEKWYAKQMGR